MRIVGEDSTIPDDKLANALIKVAEDYKRLKAQVAAMSVDNPTARSLVEQAKPEIDAGHFARAQPPCSATPSRAGRLVTNWPKKDRPLDEIQVRILQLDLKKKGYNPGEIDGMVGESLRSAVRKYQDDNGLTPDGDADLSLLKRIDAAR